MSFDQIFQLSIVGAAGAALILRIVLPYVSGKKNGKKSADAQTVLEELKEVAEQFEGVIAEVHDLHVWHGHEIRPGAKNWWILDEDRDRWKRIEDGLTDLRNDIRGSER
jgi:hypothetical protein